MRKASRASLLALASAMVWTAPARGQPADETAGQTSGQTAREATGAGPAGDRPPVLATADESPGALEAAAWSTAGISATLVLGGLILTASANAREDDIRRLVGFRATSGRPSQYQGPVAERYQDKVEEGQRLETWARVAFVGAGLTAAGAAALFVIGARSHEAVAIAPRLGPDRMGVAVRWRF